MEKRPDNFRSACGQCSLPVEEDGVCLGCAISEALRADTGMFEGPGSFQQAADLLHNPPAE